jgi:hypothetical protein
MLFNLLVPCIVMLDRTEAAVFAWRQGLVARSDS